MTFEDLLELTREGVITIQDNQEYPFEALARTLETDLSIRRETLFEVLVVYNVNSPNGYPPGPRFAPLDLRHAKLTETIAITACDAIFSFLESSTKLSGSVNYRKALFREHQHDSVNEFLNRLLRTVVFRTSAPILSAILVGGSGKPDLS
jgi:non-ribosomal peptide synthetase component F